MSTDAHRALIIYGPVIKDKTTRSIKAPDMPTFAALPIPLLVLEYHCKITICKDFF